MHVEPSKSSFKVANMNAVIGCIHVEPFRAFLKLDNAKASCRRVSGFFIRSVLSTSLCKVVFVLSHISSKLDGELTDDFFEYVNCLLASRV